MHLSSFKLLLQKLSASTAIAALLLAGVTGCEEGFEISPSAEAPSNHDQQHYSPPAALAGGGGSPTGYSGGGGGGQGNTAGEYGGAYGGGYGGGYGGRAGAPGGDYDGKPLSQASASEVLANVDRKIIYQTDISLVVKEYQSFEADLPKLVDSKSASNRRYKNQQSGEWVVRIPVSSYVDFLTGINGLGFAESRQENAQDVTDQFVDIDARIRNSKKLEERIIKMVDERVGKMSDVLEIERELSRVRQDIERMEGQLRVLGDRSAMATVTFRCREEKEYSPTAAPTYISRLQASWGDSVSSLVDFFGNGLIALVSGIPWFVTFCTPIVIGIWILRRKMMKRKLAKSTQDANRAVS